MYPTVAVLSILRNEARRWLPCVLRAWESFADVVIALDDSSTDDTASILQASPKVEYHLRSADPMWGAESSARQELWRLGVASGATWLFVLDADMVPACDPRKLLHPSADAVAFRLFDLWNLHPPLYRDDGYWRAHAVPRTWMVKNPGPGFADAWPERGIHCGHLPLNIEIERQIFAPLEHSLLHLAYSDKDSRAAKAEQYAAKAMQLTQMEQQHAASITDSFVKLKPLPIPVEYPLRKEV